MRLLTKLLSKRKSTDACVAPAPVTPKVTGFHSSTACTMPVDFSGPTGIHTRQRPYACLKSFDTIFLIDDSGSMTGRSWSETAAALETITPICTERDADGIDIYFLNIIDSTHFKNITQASTVIKIFQTVQRSGLTPTGRRLAQILRPYFQRYEKAPEVTKPINIIVITDGAPSDDVESPIIEAARKLDKLDAPAWQVGIQFFQTGKEPNAKAHLKGLDDGLKKNSGDDDLRDMHKSLRALALIGPLN